MSVSCARCGLKVRSLFSNFISIFLVSQLIVGKNRACYSWFSVCRESPVTGVLNREAWRLQVSKCLIHSLVVTQLKCYRL